MRTAENEISRWEAHTPAGTRLVGAGGVLLRYRGLSRHSWHNLVWTEAQRDRAPTAAETAVPGPGRGKGRLTGPSRPRSSAASPRAQSGPARPRLGTGAFAAMDFTGAAKGEKELREVMDVQKDGQYPSWGRSRRNKGGKESGCTLLLRGRLSPRTCPRQSCSLSFQQYRGFYRFRKALLEVRFSDRAGWALLGSRQGLRHTTFVPGPLSRACISQWCPDQQLRGREAACGAELPGVPSCKGARGPKGALASQQGRRKVEWRVEVRPWLGCSSLLAGGRCTRSMREPEKGSLGTL